MRYSPEHKRQTRERILAAAASTLKRDGLAGASVEKIMAEAGLTVGGFYAHFRSKDELLGEALAGSVAGSAAPWLQGLESSEGLAFVQGLVRRYLNRAHRDQPEIGCALAPALSELARASEETRRGAATGVEALVHSLVARLPGSSEAKRREAAIGVLALCAGGIGLSRALAGTGLSDEVLRACRSFAEAALRSEPESSRAD